jgi:methyl-accepting chemotaxis protein
MRALRGGCGSDAGGAGAPEPCAWNLLLALVAGDYSIQNFYRMVEADRWNRHTYQVLLQGGSLLRAWVAMDAGVRSFLITGDEPTLKAYFEGRKSFDAHLARARSLTRDQPSHQSRLARLAWQRTEWKSSPRARCACGAPSPDDARSLAITTRSAGARTRVPGGDATGTINDFKQFEQRLLKDRLPRQQKFQSQTGLTSLLGGLFSGVLTVALFGLVLANTRALNRSNARLQNANGELACAVARLEAQKQESRWRNAQISAQAAQTAQAQRAPGAG